MHARGLTGLVHLIFVLGLLVLKGSGLWCGALPIRPQLESLERLTDTERLQQFTRSLSLPLSLSPKEVKRAVKQAPDRLHLRQDDFLGLGVKRKSVAGVYGTSAGVSLGAAAISYQTMNLRSKNRDAVTKEQKEERVKQAICEALRRASQIPPQPPNPPSVATAVEQSSSEWPPQDTRYDELQSGTEEVWPERGAKSDWDKRGLSDATLTTIEDYNKIIGATEAIVSGSIAVTAAQQANQRSLKASTEFYC